jgi:S1-C subfamily serine protease
VLVATTIAVAAHLAWPAREPAPEAPVDRTAEAPKPEAPPASAGPNFLTAAQARANLSHWCQDVDAARRQAAAEGKSLAIVFLGSDRFSVRWLQEVLGRPEFPKALGDRYIPVLIDFPREREARAKVRDPERNLAVKRHYQVRRLPRMVLADARGLPFGLIDYAEGGIETFAKRLERVEANRAERDRLLRQIESAEGEAKLQAIEKALALLGELDLVPQYKPLLQEWLALVRQYDPGNEHGAHEAVFHAVWMVSLIEMQLDRPNRQEIDRRIAELDEWLRTHPFKNPDRAASLHYYAAGALSVSGQLDAALKQAEAGLACRPRNPILREQLAMAVAAIRGVGTGTGFAVAPGGLVLTNHHVIQGAKSIRVRVSGRGDVWPAQIVAQDAQQDIALLKVELPPGIELAPIPLAESPARRGARVLAIGFPPANSWSDAALKLTQGIISATPDETAEGMFVLDCRINPGNSGGPLCDVYGNAVGMVAAKSYGGVGVDSYGMALPSDVLRRFLARHLPPDQPLAPPRKAQRPLEWEEVAPQVSPSVMMVFRGP